MLYIEKSPSVFVNEINFLREQFSVGNHCDEMCDRLRMVTIATFADGNNTCSCCVQFLHATWQIVSKYNLASVIYDAVKHNFTEDQREEILYNYGLHRNALMMQPITSTNAVNHVCRMLKNESEFVNGELWFALQKIKNRVNYIALFEEVLRSSIVANLTAKQRIQLQRWSTNMISSDKITT